MYDTFKWALVLISLQRTKLKTETHHSTKFKKKSVHRNESPLNENEIMEMQETAFNELIHQNFKSSCKMTKTTI